MKLILGSSSPSRQQILKKMGFEFEVATADIDEKAIRDPDPEKLTLKLAHAKADAIMPKVGPGAILVTSDQVLVAAGKILEKPANQAEAREMLTLYRDHPVTAVDAVVVTNTTFHDRKELIETMTQEFVNLDSEAIEKLARQPNAIHHAGGFDITDPLIQPYLGKAQGEIETMMGLPLKTKKLIDSMLEQKWPDEFVAAAVIYNPQTNQVLLQHRSNDAEVAPNQWGLFGGSRKGQETPRETLFRELNEELGVEFKEATPLYDYFNELSNRYRYILVVETTLSKGKMTLREGQGFDWFSLNKLEQSGLSPKTVLDLRRFLDKSK